MKGSFVALQGPAKSDHMPSSGTDYHDKYCDNERLYPGIGRNWIFVAPVMRVTPSWIKWNV